MPSIPLQAAGLSRESIPPGFSDQYQKKTGGSEGCAAQSVAGKATLGNRFLFHDRTPGWAEVFHYRMEFEILGANAEPQW